MSENITILEGGKAENFGQIAKLRTNNGDGYDLWVPEKDVDTKSLSVNKNGLYYTNQYEPTLSEKKDGKAYDIYGWDTITVSVKQKVTGKKKKLKPDGTEIDVPTSVEVDDNGNLVEKELPTSIMVITPPRKTGYHAGETIDIAGIVVKAYLEDGTEYAYDPQHNNAISLDELSIDPTTCPSGGSGHEYSNGNGLNALKIWYEQHSHIWDYNGWTYYQWVYPSALGMNNASPPVPVTLDGNGAAELYLTRYQNELYACRISGDDGFGCGNIYPDGYSGYHANDGSGVVYLGWGTTTYKTTQGRFTEASWGEYITEVPSSTVNPANADPSSLRALPSSAEITVTWHRPDDGKALTDTFEIHVLSE